MVDPILDEQRFIDDGNRMPNKSLGEIDQKFQINDGTRIENLDINFSQFIFENLDKIFMFDNLELSNNNVYHLTVNTTIFYENNPSEYSCLIPETISKHLKIFIFLETIDLVPETHWGNILSTCNSNLNGLFPLYRLKSLHLAWCQYNKSSFDSEL